ncbi:MAG: phosphoribosyltransferase [Candidatus Taylorbacteria bacterium]|nr:phosphoribosyltransferase [Candidatus Taylorbacteria bacterium]
MPHASSAIIPCMDTNITHIAWIEVEEHCRSLAAQIAAAGFAPDYLVGIATGGVIPLALIAKEFKNSNIVTVSVSSYEKDTRGELVVKYLPKIDLAGKKILLVDEIAETGRTLRKVADILRNEYNVAELKTVVIAVNKDKCVDRPDFFGVEGSNWFVFPWEKAEFPEYFQNSRTGEPACFGVDLNKGV